MKPLLPFLLSLMTLFAFRAEAIYIPLNISSGFTADVVANGVGTALSTTSATMDGASYVFPANGWQQTSSATPCTTGLPVNGIINSAVTSGLTYQLANYTGNNVLRISTNNTQSTLTFQTSYSAQTLYLLAVTGSGTSTITVQTEFTDGSNQINTGILVADWYGGANIAYTGFQRLNRTTNAMNNNANGPNLYQYGIAIDVANQAKLISSIKVTRTAATSTTPTLNILAVSVNQGTITTCSAPTLPSAANITSTSASLDWSQTGTPLNYQIKYGAPGFNVTTAGTSVFTSNKPYTLNPPLTPSTSYSFYVRAVCSAGDTSAWSPIANFTTFCSAPSISATTDSFNCGSGSVTLGASTNPNANLKWYTTATGGSPVGSGSVFTTPYLNNTTNFYVEAVQLSSLGQAGRNNYTGTAQATPNSTGQGIQFSALANLNLDSVAVWVVADTGRVIVQLQNTGNTVLTTDTFTFSGTGATASSRVKIYLPVNYSIPAGSNYKILALSGTTATLSREQSVNPTFSSYNIPNVITFISSWVNGASNTANYYYFYNLYVSSGCASPRQMVMAAIRPVPTVNLGVDTTICPGASYTLNAGNAGATYLWQGGQASQTLTTNTAGVYSVKVTADGCSKSDTMLLVPGLVPSSALPAAINLCEGSQAVLDAGNAGSTYIWTPGGATTQTNTITTGGPHAVEIKSADGCVITNSTDVTMHPLPITNLGNDTVICAAQSLMLDAGNTGSIFLWNDGSITQTINSTDSGMYKVQVISPYNCLATDSIHIAFLPAPRTNGFNFVPLFFDQLGKVAFEPLNPENASSFIWNFGDGSATATQMNPIHVYASSGSFEVTLTAVNNCDSYSVSQQISVEIDESTGVNSLSPDPAVVTVYPNPAKTTVKIKSGNSEIKEIFICNAFGMPVFHEKLNTHQNSIEILTANFSNGLYTLRIITSAGLINKSVIVLH